MKKLEVGKTISFKKYLGYGKWSTDRAKLVEIEHAKDGSIIGYIVMYPNGNTRHMSPFKDIKVLDNPAKTVAQQKLFAIALGIKKGQIARSYSPEAAKMADRMSVRKLEEFARTRFENPLQQNLLPEIGALALTGFGIGLGYKSAGALWNKVSKRKKNPQADDKPDPKGQTCPKCGKVYHDYKWGGCGKCSCGYYFHPEWYGKSKNPVQFQGRCAKCGSWLIRLSQLKTAKNKKFDRYVEYRCIECGHLGVFYFKVVKQTNPGEAYHNDRAAMFEGFARTAGIKQLERKGKMLAENERHNAKMSKDLGIMNPISKKVHPKAFELRDMYRGDVKAGHTEAAYYWRGGAAALFTDGNPKKRRK